MSQGKATRAPLATIVTTRPGELVCIDFLQLETCKQGFEYILVVKDHFTGFAQAYATKNKSSKAVVGKLFNDFALRVGFPERIHHDMGREFDNQLMDQLQKSCDVRGSHTTCYHPQGNGKCEIASKTAAREDLRGKRGYNKRIHGVDLPGYLGDECLCVTCQRGKTKCTCWRRGGARTARVYEVAPEGGGKSRVSYSPVTVCPWRNWNLPLKNKRGKF